MIRAVIFDLGGVLVRTEDRAPRERLAAQLGMTYSELSAVIFDSESARLATLGTITTEQHWESVRITMGLAPDEFPGLMEQFWAGDRLDEGLVNLIRSLRSRYKTGLLSNAWDDLRHALVNQWRIDDAFHEVIISSEVGLAKPNPGIYHLALERVQVTPVEAVFVDDFIENVESAHQVGMQAIHFRDSDQARNELLQLLDRR